VHSLVIGGTGPTGHFIVNGLRARGHAVTILHTGRHEIPEIPPEVEHVHTDPYAPDALREALEGRSFDVCVAMYGRLRAIAELMKGRCGRFLSVGGVPAYRGYMNPELFEPPGLPVPTSEDAPLVREPSHDEKGYRIVRTEERVLEVHPDATHFRYPFVYGPYQPVPREWCVVRRILDGRPHMVLADDGLTLQAYGYVENLAHALLLAIDQPEASRGQIYNATDAEVLSQRQVVEVIAATLEHDLEIVSMPWALATPARPLIGQRLPTHRVLDVAKLKNDLGYEDAVPPREAVARTARWLVEHPPAPGGPEEMVLQDPFDYAAEDRLIAAWREALASMPEVAFETPPGLGLAYSGPGGRERTKPRFEED
jgi:nucleoside-diphosphate-sugar epimerase